jgi:N-methylhydantoinase B/oxoprolinase/acetone carboxylase alpha subunit
MSTEFKRDLNNNNALINRSSSSYTSRMKIKENFKVQQSKISDLETQIADLKSIVDSLTSSGE